LLEQVELLRGELELALATPGPVRTRVDPHVSRLQRVGGGLAARRVAATEQGAHPCRQRGEGERPGDIVVRAGVETEHLVELAAARRRHQHGQPGVSGASAAADLDAVDAG
jgi:hypothetical protein